MESNKNTEIITNIKNILKSRNIKQADLARMCNTRTSVISEFLNGKYKKPSIDLLQKISTALNVTISELTNELPVSIYSFLKPPRHPSLKKDYDGRDAEGKKRFRQQLSEDYGVLFIEDMEVHNNKHTPIDKYTLIIEKAKGYDISPEKLEKIIEFLAENK